MHRGHLWAALLAAEQKVAARLLREGPPNDLLSGTRPTVPGQRGVGEILMLLAFRRASPRLGGGQPIPVAVGPRVLELAAEVARDRRLRRTERFSVSFTRRLARGRSSATAATS